MSESEVQAVRLNLGCGGDLQAESARLQQAQELSELALKLTPMLNCNPIWSALWARAEKADGGLSVEAPPFKFDWAEYCNRSAPLLVAPEGSQLEEIARETVRGLLAQVNQHFFTGEEPTALCGVNSWCRPSGIYGGVNFALLPIRSGGYDSCEYDVSDRELLQTYISGCCLGKEAPDMIVSSPSLWEQAAERFTRLVYRVSAVDLQDVDGSSCTRGFGFYGVPWFSMDEVPARSIYVLTLGQVRLFSPDPGRPLSLVMLKNDEDGWSVVAKVRLQIACGRPSSCYRIAGVRSVSKA